ncbi:MAG: hypothetical protein IPJ48_17635 [Propionivibrio sp.]|uniref:Uncharacterized protein n=1 Tax=Candidatus Propionivibrio dominans TaxID=2954373 RepID=A0A9D7F9Q0_9RHOO|nr:hypothetical protein [Candidatus Propionivibrio dominans]
MTTYLKDATLDGYCFYVLSNTNEDPAYDIILNNLLKIEIAPEMVLELLETIKQRNLAHTIALAAIDVTEGKKSFLELSSLITEHTDEAIVEENTFVSDNLEELYENHIKTRT